MVSCTENEKNCLDFPGTLNSTEIADLLNSNNRQTDLLTLTIHNTSGRCVMKLPFTYSISTPNFFGFFFVTGRFIIQHLNRGSN